MGILDRFAPVTPPVGVGVQADMQAQIAALKAAEDAKLCTPEVREAFAILARCSTQQHEGQGLGMPVLTHDAAKAKALIDNLPYQGQGFAGSGLAAQVTLSTTKEVIDMAAELAGRFEPATAAAPAPVAPAHVQTPAPILPADAPKSNPVMAAQAVGAVAPATPPVAAAAPPVASEAPPAPRKRGRPAGSKNLPKTEGGSEAPTPSTEGFSLYVDCFPDDVPTFYLEAKIDTLTREIAERYGAVDIRCGAKDGPLCYNQWRGVLAAVLREAVETGKIAGTFTLDSSTDFGAIAAEALRPLADVYVRGVR